MNEGREEVINMDMLGADKIQELLLFIPPFILSLSFHEFAHGWAANRLGDSTARYMGRLTLDPMAHISLVGTVIFPAISVLTGAPLFGWANPVPVDARNFKNPRRDMAIVGAAGPVSNILLATLATALLSFLVHHGGAQFVGRRGTGGIMGPAIQMLVLAIQLNLFLAFFNLVPIPPLDGSQILKGLVSKRTALKLDSWTEYGSWLLLILLFTGGLKYVSIPVFMFMSMLFSWFGL